jgi:hypothetical protein
MIDGTHRNVREVAGEIDALRGDIGGLVAELDRRRHEMMDLRLQARRHPVFVAAVVAGAALVVGSLVAVALRARSERRRPAVKARHVRDAMRRLVDHPHRVAAEPSMTQKIVTAIAIAAGTAATKRLMERAIAPPPPRRTAMAR